MCVFVLFFFTFTPDIILLPYQYQLTSVYHCVLSEILLGLDHVRTCPLLSEEECVRYHGI